MLDERRPASTRGASVGIVSAVIAARLTNIGATRPAGDAPQKLEEHMVIREATAADLGGILELYKWLKDEEAPLPERADETMAAIMADERHHLLVGEEDGRVVTSCVVVIVPNLTRQCRPYALVENVVTVPDMRGRGCATAILAHARRIAEDAGCYKIMLMTGSKQESTLRFYERAGYDLHSKTGCVIWLGEH